LQSTDLQTYSVDVGESQEAVVAAFQKIVEAFGEVDVLVNCAGTSISGRIMRSI
jgi:NAD(P)-dependent dehydrogenase (short-subunit alcohol dehydrogenase family)